MSAVQPFFYSDIDEFFRQGENGSWMRWLGQFGGGLEGFVYFDDHGNLEIYADQAHAGMINRVISQYATSLNIIPKTIVVPNLDMTRVDELADKRACLYTSGVHPNAVWLDQMMSLPPQDCESLLQEVQKGDIFEGVHVLDFRPAYEFSVDEFLAAQPPASSTWMLWGVDNRQGPNTYIYTDSNGGIEVYTSDMSLPVPELPPTDYNLYVQIPNDVSPLQLNIARSRLYNSTKSLGASRDQLEDMVQRIQSIPFTPADPKNWGNQLYQKFKKQAPGEWTYRPSKGLIPKQPQFYFNPKPLKKGDPNKPLDNVPLDELAALVLGGDFVYKS